MRKQFLKSMLLALLCVVGGVTSAWAAKGDVTTHADIDFSNAITGTKPYTIDGTVGQMTWTQQWTMTPNITDGILRFGNFTGGVVELQNNNIRKKDVVTITFDLAFGKLSGKHVGFEFRDADGNTILNQLFDAYNGDFDDANPLNLDWNNMYHSSNTVIQDRCVYFTITIDYAAKKITTHTKCFKEGTGKAVTEADAVAVAPTGIISQFVLTGNINNADRYSTFDNLKITSTEGDYTVATANYTVKQVCGNNELSTITLNGDVGDEASILTSHKNAFFNEDQTKRYIYVSDDAEGKTIAADGSTVVTITFREAEKYTYTVTSTYNSQPLAWTASGEVWEDLNTVSVYYPRFQASDASLVELKPNDNNLKNTFTVDATNFTKALEYSATDPAIDNLYGVYEAEALQFGLNTSEPSGFAARCSGYKIIYGAKGDLITLPAGKYIFTLGAIGGDNDTHSTKYIVYKEATPTEEGAEHSADKKILEGTCNGNFLTLLSSEEFILTEETTISFTCSDPSSTRGIDLIYVQKTGEASADALLAAAKADLQSLIAEAEALDANDLANAIGTANTALNAQDATVESLKSAKTALQQAIDAWKASKMFMGETGKYYLKNVASGKFLGAGNSWGTQASLLEHPEYLTLNKLNDGKYNIDSQVSNGGNNHYFNGSFMDNNSPLELTIAKSGDYYTISGNIKVEEQTVLRYFGYDGPSTVLAALEESGNNALWQIFSEAEMLATLSTATIDAPVDATFFILDPNFGRNNRNSAKWEGTALTKSGDNSNMNVQAYMATFDTYQTLSGMPNGTYKLTAQAAVTFHDNRTVKDYDGNGYPLIYAGETTSNFLDMETADRLTNQTQLSKQFTAGKYYVEPIFVEVTDGTLKVGAKSTRADIWAVWDNFQLAYYGNVSLNEVILADYIKALNEAIAETETFNAEQNKIGTAEQTALTPAYNAAKAIDVDKTTQEDLIAATNALKSAVADAQASKNAYATVEAVLAAATTNLQSTNVYTSAAYTTFSEAITTAQTNYNNNTMTTAEATGLQAKLNRAVWGTTPAPMACDYIISAWTSTNNVAVANFWSSEGDAEGSSGMTVPFIQYWVGDNDKMADNTVTGTVNGLDNGLYSVTAFMRVVNKKEGNDAGYDGITLKVNDGNAVAFADATTYSDGYAKEITAEGLVKDGNLTITIDVKGTNASWLSFKNVKYVKVRDLTEDEMGVTAEELAAFDEALTNAKGVDQNKKMNAEVLATLQNAIAANVDRNDRAAVVSATKTLNDAAENANKSIAAYTAINDAMVAASETAKEKLDQAGAAAFNDEIANLEGAYNNGTLTSMADDNVATTLANALATGAKAQTTPNADMTLAIINNSFETGDLTGWILKKYSSDTGVKDNTGNYATTGIDGNKLFNTWWQGVPLQQTITELPAGSYKLSALIASGDDNVDAKIFLTVNDNRQLFTRPAGSKGTFADCSMIFALSEKSDVTIGIVGGTDNGDYVEDGHWWYKADNFRLQKISSTIGDGTPSLAEGTYTQQNTLDISFNPVAISDADVFAILDAEKITVNNKQAQATLEGNKLTVTLADLLSTGTEYVVTLAAGAVGYSAQNANSEQTFTVKTPALFDGTYYIATNEEQPRYISRGGDSQTEAALDRYGIAAKFTTDAKNVTHVTFVDNNKNLFGGSQSIYTDKTEADLGDNAARARFTIEQGQNGLAFYNLQWKKYIAAGTGAESGAQAAVYAEEPYYWNLMNAATHAQLTATYKDRNALAVAEAAGLTNVTTAAQLNEAITANGWMSKNIELANSYSAVTESWQYDKAPAIIAEQQLTGLEKGIYKVSLSGFHRMASNDATYELNKQLLDGSTTYLWANDQQLQFPSVMSEGADVAYTKGQNPNYAKDDKNYPNSMGAAGQAFSNGLYTIEVFAYVGQDGKLSLGATAPAKYTNSNWICWRDLKVTYYTDFVGNYSQLEKTVATCENYTLGFEANEYAPYQNAEKLIALKQAQALLDNRDATTQTEIDALNTTLSTGWTANSEEVNAIFWKTDYTAADKASDGYVHPIGWTNTGYNTRVMNSELAPNDAAMKTIGTAVFSKFNTTYGEKEGYTMPLKASTVYNISFRYCGWGNNPTTNVVLSVDGEAVAVTPTSFRPATNDGNTNAEHWYEYNGYFTTTKAGNYVLALNKVDQGQQQIAWTDLTLKRAVAENITIAENADYVPAARYGNVTFERSLVEGWNGLTVPFDMTVNDVKTTFKAEKVKNFKGIILNDDETVTLNFEDATEVKAGVPFLVKAAAAGNSFDMGTMVLSDNAAVKPVTYTAEGNENIRYTMQSSYKAETDLTDVVFALIQGNKFFYHNTGKPSSAKAFRAWFVNESTDAETAARLRFDLGDDETTGIKSIANDADSLTATYDLQGRAVKTAAKKGLYIKNGKKMVVK